jgi:hypothetical protein
MAVSKTTNSGGDWTRYTFSSNGYTYALAVDPSNSDIVYAGGDPRLYKTTNGGLNWLEVDAGLSGHVSCLAIDPNTTTTLYAGTSDGVFKSINSATTWNNTGCAEVTTILIDPNNTNIIYAGTNSGVYKSTAGGGNWTVMNDGLGDALITCLGINPELYLFAGTKGSAMYRWDLRRELNVSPVSIDISAMVPENTTLNPQATVKNLGRETVSFEVTCEIIDPGTYTSFVMVNALAPESTIQVTFPDDFTFTTVGFCTVTVYTELVGDENPGNDTCSKVIETISVSDVKPVSIDIADTFFVYTDTTFSPQASVTNLGTATETFDVTCEIEPGGYDTTTTITDLAPGETLQVTFLRDFTFALDSTYTVVVYTQLLGDENPGNDTTEAVIYVHDLGICEDGSMIPTSYAFTLKNNPAKNQAVFALSLPEAARVTLSIYDVTGRRIDQVITEKRAAGYYEIPWRAKANAGVYFYSFESPWENKVGKLVLVR